MISKIQRREGEGDWRLKFGESVASFAFFLVKFEEIETHAWWTLLDQQYHYGKPFLGLLPFVSLPSDGSVDRRTLPF